MIQASLLQDFVRAAPFRPFRLHMASGMIFEVGHPGMIVVGKTFLVIVTYLKEGPGILKRYNTISIMLIEYVDYMEPDEPF